MTDNELDKQYEELKRQREELIKRRSNYFKATKTTPDNSNMENVELAYIQRKEA